MSPSFPTSHFSTLAAIAAKSAALVALCFAIAAAIVLTGCAAITRLHASQWPAPRFDNYHAADAKQRDHVIFSTLISNPKWFVTSVQGTSMEPHIRSTPGTRLLFEPVAAGRKWTEADLGLVVVFERQAVRYFTRDRWDSAPYVVTAPDPTGASVCHMVAAVSPDGRSVLLTGTNTDRSDGWQPATNIRGILRLVVTIPPGATS